MTSGDDERFRALVDAHFGDLWRFARRRSPTAEAADDVTAEVVAVAWRRRDALPADRDARLWLFGVARRVLANHRTGTRHDRLVRRMSAVADIDIDGASGDRPEGADDDVRGALADLADADRTVIEMRCWDGLAVVEIAELLGCSPNAVSIRLHRARKELAARLGPRGAARKEPSHDGH